MSADSLIDKPWAGRFNEPTDAFVEAFTASVDFDRRLYRHDIEGSIAHARMPAAQGILTAVEGEAIVAGLIRIRERIEAGEFRWSVALEDVHMNVESALTEAIGVAGKKLHTGRSRNDQVATDIRLYLRAEIDEIRIAIRRLQGVLLDLAEREADSILPGFTHLQAAQPISFGHHLMAWFEMLERDWDRLGDCRRRVNLMPLGAAEFRTNIVTGFCQFLSINDPDSGGTPLVGVNGTNAITINNTINPQERSDVNFKLVVPGGLPSFPRIYAVVDQQNTLTEIHEDNNKGFNVLGASSVVGIDDENYSLPEKYMLYQSYPNPFNPVTTIRYAIPQDARLERQVVTLKVYDILGREVVTLVNEEKQPGEYEVKFHSYYSIIVDKIHGLIDK